MNIGLLIMDCEWQALGKWIHHHPFFQIPPRQNILRIEACLVVLSGRNNHHVVVIEWHALSCYPPPSAFLYALGPAERRIADVNLVKIYFDASWWLKQSACLMSGFQSEHQIFLRIKAWEWFPLFFGIAVEEVLWRIEVVICCTLSRVYFFSDVASRTLKFGCCLKVRNRGSRIEPAFVYFWPPGGREGEGREQWWSEGRWFRTREVTW